MPRETLPALGGEVCTITMSGWREMANNRGTRERRIGM